MVISLPYVFHQMSLVNNKEAIYLFSPDLKVADSHAIKAHYKCFYKFYQDKFADCDAGLLIKDVGMIATGFL